MSGLIHYNYVHSQTESTTGYFSCLPDPPPGAKELVSLIAERPLDSFLRRHAIDFFAARDAEFLNAAFFEAADVSDECGCGALASFLAELALINPALQSTSEALSKNFSSPDLFAASPLLCLRRGSLPDAPLHAAWAELFNTNIQGHRKLPPPDKLAARGLPSLFTPEALEAFAAEPKLTLPALAAARGGAYGAAAPDGLMPAAEVAELAMKRLQIAGAVGGQEQRHIASLSPIGLLMPWRLDVSVSDGRNNYSLKGQANTYGRGLSLDQARASCRMEMVERFSAYLSLAGGEVKDRAAPMPLQRGRRGELLERGHDAIDPNDFYIEAPYADQELVWAPALLAQGKGEYRPVLTPLQMAALFSNCDEIDLCSAPGSTGIATGSIVEQARLAALIEVIERDSEATLLYSKQRCFQLDADSAGDESLAALLRDYRTLGINLQFMDLTGPLGLPCYQAFVIGPKGGIHRGHGASLSGTRALISAITETPYPYPDGGPSGPMLRNLPARSLGELPDYGTGSVKGDLRLLEDLLCANGQNPVYVDLTHSVLKFPVVRALIPGLRLAADFDEFSRISPYLYKDYLQLQK